VTGRRRSVCSEKTGREYRAPKSNILAKADNFATLEGSNRSPVSARASDIAGVQGRGMFSKRSPVNPGELTIPSKYCAQVPRIRNGTRSMGQEGRTHRSQHALIEVSRCQGKPEAAGMDSTAVLRTHSTYEDGEPQGSRKGRPGYPLEGRGEQMDGATQ